MSETVIANRYRLDSLIATGAMGAVWRAHDPRLDRPVAVKLLKNSVFEDGARARARFEREARAAAKLKGPGIVAVHDHGEDTVGDDSVAYLVMELVEGESLSAVLDREGSLSAGRTLDLVAAVAAALDVAHRQGIVHRDIKP
ncbi:serine/threonine-protein kinase, partial [Glycomyces tenuis]|uniref:serine/threonine-protein kinase n=1 Tax=Glycomyces tenuis TaxID=58116 RepID=UPI000558FD63